MSCPLKPGLQCSDPDHYKTSTPCPGCTARTCKQLAPSYGGGVSPLTVYLDYEPEEIRVSPLHLTANSMGVVL